MAKRTPATGRCGELRYVALDRLRPHPENDNRENPQTFAKLVATIREEGFAQPIVARSGGDGGPFADGRLEILGGEWRWRAAQKLHMTEVPVYDLGAVGNLRARKLIVNLNKLHGEADQDALAALVKSIAAEGGEEALAALALDEDALRDLLDDQAEAALGVEPPPPAGEPSEGAAHDLGAGVTPRDLLVLLEVQKLNRDELAGLLEAARQWAFGREDQGMPAWRDLMALLQRSTRRR